MIKLLLVFALISNSVFAQNNMKQMVEFLADDKLEGRKPGQPGNQLAIDYIKKQLKTIGIAPLGSQYEQEFTIFTHMEKMPSGNTLSISNQTVDFEPLSYSLSGDYTGELVFAGFGISIPKGDPNLVYDDYKNLDAKNKIVVIFTGDPGIGNTQSVFRKPDYINYRSLFYKLKNAIKHGARAVILIENPLGLAGGVDELYFKGSEGGGERFSAIAGKTKNSEFDKLLLGTNTLELQKQIASSQKPFSFELNANANINVNLKKVTGRVANINGVIKGSGDGVIVLGAHMDHLGWGGESSADTSNTPQIHNGADDNASGTAMVIHLAKLLSQLKLEKTVVFSLFNAEEMGLLGSEHFASSWESFKAEYGAISAMFNFDMVGRFQQEISVMGVASSPQFQNMLTGLGDNDFRLKNQAIGSSDHAPFILRKIPSLFFTTGAHEDYHKPSDDSDKIDYKSMDKLAKFAVELIKKADTSQIVFDENYQTGDEGGSRGYGASLGCIPKFGQSDDIIGVQCSGATPNSAAASIGIQADDVIVKIGEIEIKSVYDLAFALRYYRPGDKVNIQWKRAEKLFSQMATLKKSSRS